MKTKALRGLKIVDEAEGKVQAVFATLNVIDLDGDVTRKGAYQDGAEVVVSAYNHGSWQGKLPVGKGTIHEVGDEAILDAQFFMGTTHGRDTFETVKELGDLGEWSYSLHDVAAERGVFDEKQVQFLNKITVREVSPVIKGAGVATRTLVAKSAKQLNSDVARRLRDAGKERFGGDETYVWLDDFDVDDEWAVFCVETDDTVRNVQVDYTRADDGVTLADEETEVERTTAYAPKGRGQRLSEHLDAVIADVELVSERVAAAVAQRAEQNGQKLAAATLERGAKLETQITRLREALAIEPQTSAEWRQAKAREARARELTARKGHA